MQLQCLIAPEVCRSNMALIAGLADEGAIGILGLVIPPPPLVF